MQLPAVHPILEARDAAGGAAEAPTPRPAVVAVDLVKTYGSGEAAVTALGSVSGRGAPADPGAVASPTVDSRAVKLSGRTVARAATVRRGRRRGFGDAVVARALDGRRPLSAAR